MSTTATASPTPTTATATATERGHKKRRRTSGSQADPGRERGDARNPTETNATAEVIELRQNLQESRDRARDLARQLEAAQHKVDESAQTATRVLRRYRTSSARLRDAMQNLQRSESFVEQLQANAQMQEDQNAALLSSLQRCYQLQPMYPHDCSVCHSSVVIGHAENDHMYRCSSNHYICHECLTRAQQTVPPRVHLLNKRRVCCPLHTGGDSLPCFIRVDSLPRQLQQTLHQREPLVRQLRTMLIERRHDRQKCVASTLRYAQNASDVADALFASPCPGCFGAGPFSFQDCMAVHTCSECCALLPRAMYHCPFCAFLSLVTTLLGADALDNFGAEVRADAQLTHLCELLPGTTNGPGAHAHAIDCPCRTALGARSGYFSTPSLLQHVNRQLRRVVLVAVGAARWLGVANVFATDVAALRALRDTANPRARAGFDRFVRDVSAAITRKNADLGNLPVEDNFYGADDEPDDAPLPTECVRVRVRDDENEDDGIRANEDAEDDENIFTDTESTEKDRYFHHRLEGTVWKRCPDGVPRLLPGTSELARYLHKGIGVPLPGSRVHALLCLYMDARFEKDDPRRGGLAWPSGTPI